MQEKDIKMIGIDIGGSHITAALIDLKNQCIVQETFSRNHVDTHGSPEQILPVWVSTIKKVIGHLDKHEKNNIRIGIAMPGPFDYENGISLITGMNKYESLYKINISQYLTQHLNIDTDRILFRNDAEAFLHGEVHCGIARGKGKALGITLGTGLGSAVHYKGVTTDANLGISPFKNGIAEDYLSTRWFVKRYREVTGNSILDAKPIFLLLDSDLSAKAIIEEFTINLSLFLDEFIKRENPSVVVIGGNIARAHAHYIREVNAKLVKLGNNVPVVISSLWEDAAMIGTACYWNHIIVQV